MQAKIADAKAMTEAITQMVIETAKGVVQAVGVAGAEAGVGPRCKSVSMGPKLGRSTLKEPTFYRSASDKYAEFQNLMIGGK